MATDQILDGRASLNKPTSAVTFKVQMNDAKVVFVELAAFNQVSLVTAADRILGVDESLTGLFSTDETGVEPHPKRA